MVLGWLYLVSEHALMRLFSNIPILLLTTLVGVGIGGMALLYPDLLFSGEETLLEYIDERLTRDGDATTTAHYRITRSLFPVE